MKSAVFLWFLVVVLPLSAAAQKGVLLYKDAPWDRDQFARATPYKEVEKFPTVHNLVPMSGNKIRVNSALVVKDVPFPTEASLADISEEAQVKALEETVADWSAATKRYPSSAKYLTPRIAQLQTEIAQFRAGKVKVAGAWMTKEALLTMQKKAEEERRKLQARLEEEAKQLGMLAEEWANLDEAGRKRAREAKLRAEEAEMRLAEERRIQLAIEKQRKLAEERAKMKPAERLATDIWITPPGLNEQQTKEYEEARALVKEQLGKARQDLGFGKESQRMVLKTTERIYAFKPADLSRQVQIVRPEQKDQLPLIMLASVEGKEVIESLSVTDREQTTVAAIALPTVAATDVEKLTQGLSQIIELCGGKQDAAKEEPKSE